MIFTVEERDELLSGLTAEQQKILTERLTRSRRTLFANVMARDKGLHIPATAEPEDIELLLSDWIYAGYTDAGKVTPELRCECGRPLRYQHRVENKSTGEVRKFGIEHLKEHLGIGADVVAAIKKGFEAIDYELDEILLKHKQKWQPDPDWLHRSDLPHDIALHLNAGLPLLERQIRRLRQMRTAASKPAVRPAVQAPAAASPLPPADLFSYQEQEEAREQSTDELAEKYRPAVRHYLQTGVRSARMICEMLIVEHGAPTGRFLTNKPKLFLAVCRYIEASFPQMQIVRQGTEDRLYTPSITD